MVEGTLCNDSNSEFTLTGAWDYRDGKIHCYAWVPEYEWNAESEMYDIVGAELITIDEDELELAMFHNQGT